MCISVFSAQYGGARVNSTEITRLLTKALEIVPSEADTRHTSFYHAGRDRLTERSNTTLRTFVLYANKFRIPRLSWSSSCAGLGTELTPGLQHLYCDLESAGRAPFAGETDGDIWMDIMEASHGQAHRRLHSLALSTSDQNPWRQHEESVAI